jgi:hypothetical protein
LDAALFDPPFRTFAGKEWAPERVAPGRVANPEARAPSVPSPCAAIPRAGSFLRKRQTSGGCDGWILRCRRDVIANLVGLWSGSHTEWSTGHTTVRFVVSQALGTSAVETILGPFLPLTHFPCRRSAIPRSVRDGTKNALTSRDHLAKSCSHETHSESRRDVEIAFRKKQSSWQSEKGIIRERK